MELLLRMKHFSYVLSEQRQRHFNWNYISLSLLLPTKRLQFVINQLQMCIESISICNKTTCSETTLSLVNNLQLS